MTARSFALKNVMKVSLNCLYFSSGFKPVLSQYKPSHGYVNDPTDRTSYVPLLV
ncbi:conserved hypothetical protein [Vibrio coralliirubri]|nr:conserved hypothetical protein [Vibrio coralliirubri]CDU08906.1 conserved hypothetical protein [Vibrio coralliirubri]